MRKGEHWDEVMVATELDQFRREQAFSQGVSFKTIVAFGTHSSFHHYEPNNITTIKIDNSSLLLVDSGGQYLGTIFFYFLFMNVCIVEPNRFYLFIYYIVLLII